MKTTDVLDHFRVELLVSKGCSEEKKRDTIRRLDESRFSRIVKAALQQALNESAMNDVMAEIRR